MKVTYNIAHPTKTHVYHIHRDYKRVMIDAHAKCCTPSTIEIDFDDVDHEDVAYSVERLLKALVDGSWEIISVRQGD